MLDGGPEAKRPREGAARCKNTKPLVSAKRPGTKTVRVQLHLEEKTVERLGVHCSLVHRNSSAVAGEVLDAWLRRYGRGRAVFGDDLGPGEVVSDPPPAL